MHNSTLRTVCVAVATLIVFTFLADAARAADPVPDMLWATNGTGSGFQLTFRVAALPDGGVTSVTTSDSGTALPTAYKLGEETVWYDVDTTATYRGTIELCFSWNEGDFANEANIALLHYVGGQWVDITTVLDTDENYVCGETSSLSPFVMVEIEYVFGGIRQPVNADGSSIFKAGSVVPLKFGLTGPGGATVTNAVATLSLYRIADEVSGTDEEKDVDASGNANEGDLFRVDSGGGAFVYNLSTKGYSAGTYRAEIHLDDGSTHEVGFSLR